MKALSSTEAEIERAAADWVLRRDAGLTAEEARALKAWIEADPRHTEIFVRLTGTWSAFERDEDPSAAHELAATLRSRAARRHKRRMRLGVAASLLMLGSVGVWWNGRMAPAASPAPMVAQVESLRKLPDGSLVELNEGAEIVVRYDEQFRRVQLLRGEAHFRVVKSPARPFLVEAGKLEVRAVGTAFAVDLQSRGVEVVVTEGRVAVAVDQSVTRDSVPDTSDAQTRPAIPAATVRETLAFVDAGSGVLIHNEATAATAAEVRPMSDAQITERLAWRGTRLEFNNVPLMEAVARMNRHNALQIMLGDPALRSIKISGVFHADNPEGFVRILEGTLELNSERHGDDQIVLQRAR